MSEAQKRYRDGLKEKGVVVKCPPRSKETLERMAQAQRGKKASEVARKNMSLANSNPSSETRAKLAEASRSRDPEWKAWFAQNQKGKPKSAEHRAKISAAHKARRLNSSTVLPVTKGMTRKAGAS
jgi:hypothetical protein